MTTEIITLESDKQRLQLAPRLGGGIAVWEWQTEHGWAPLFRPWDGQSEDRYTFACFPLIPWSNRITQGGFEHNGVFHPIDPNRVGEPYPIHGDGWLQSWNVVEHAEDSVVLSLESHECDGNPYSYIGTQRVTLLPDGLAIDLSVTHLGEESLPYGLGLHPYFMRNSATRLRSKASGVWLSGSDPIPISHSNELPPTWDYNQFAPLEGPLIDNCFSGWDGKSVIDYPNRGYSITMSMANCNGYSLMYRPPGLDYFCLEPITHPIDAFHMPGQPGLARLSAGQSLSLKTTFLIS
jgi:aldose 1-epimerase